MAKTNLLSPGYSFEFSNEFTVADGARVVVVGHAASQSMNWDAVIQYKNSDGSFVEFDKFNNRINQIALTVPGVYRVARVRGGCMVDVVDMPPGGPTASGGGGDASATNQSAGNTLLTAISTATGAQADAPATSDAGAFSFIALIKRLLSKLPASLGVKTAAGSLPVVLAFDQPVVPIALPGPTNSTTTIYARSQVLKAGPGTLYGMSGYNSRTSEQFIQVHDAAAEPSVNAVPKILLKVAASSPFSIDFGPRGRSFSTGIVVCNSTTGPAFSIGAADCWFDGQVG